MAVAVTEAKRLISRPATEKSLVRRILDRMIEARMAQAQSIVDEQAARTHNHKKSIDDKLDTMVVGKNGLYAWPY